MNGWEAIMLIAGGLFAGGGATFAWSRVPIWRGMAVDLFVADFAQTLDRTDKVQPALLVVAIASSLGFAVTSDGSSRVLALVASAGFATILVASLAVLVPLQRRIIRGAERDAVDEMREKWFQGNLGRASLSVAAFAAAAMAAALA